MPYNVLSPEKRAGIWLMYLRKSRQDDPRESVEEVLAKHEAMLQEWARRELGREIPEDCIYREVISGGESIEDREEIQKVLARVEDPKVAGLICADPQRLTRGSLEDCGLLITTLRYTRSLVATPMRVYDIDDKMERRFFEQELMRGRDYLDYVTEKLSMGKEAAVRNRGSYIGSAPPYGYDKIKIGKNHTLTPKEPEADVVRLIFDWFVNEGIGPGAIARRLNDMGIKPRSSGIWYVGTVRRMLSNKHYDGKVVYYKRKTEMVIVDGKPKKTRNWQEDENVLVGEGIHPAIVDHDLFMKAQEKRYHEPRVKMDHRLTNPLAGLVFCSKCGHNFVSHPYKNSETRMECRYHKPSCMKSVKLSAVKEAVIVALEQSELPNLKAKLQGGEGKSIAIQQRILAGLEAQMKKLREQEDKQYDLLETGVYTQQKFEERNGALRIKIDACQKQIFEAKSKMPKEVDYAERIVTLEAAITALKENTAPIEEQNKLLKKIIERIDITVHTISAKKSRIELKVFLRF